MNYLIAILACFVTVSFLLKVGFFATKGLVAVGIVFAIFTLCVTPRMTELSHDVFLQITTTKEILLNVAVCMVLESVIMIAYCFTCPPMVRMHCPAVIFSYDFLTLSMLPQ